MHPMRNEPNWLQWQNSPHLDSTIWNASSSTFPISRSLYLWDLELLPSAYRLTDWVIQLAKVIIVSILLVDWAFCWQVPVNLTGITSTINPNYSPDMNRGIISGWMIRVISIFKYVQSGSYCLVANFQSFGNIFEFSNLQSSSGNRYCLFIICNFKVATRLLSSSDA